MSELEAAAAMRWQLQNNTVYEMPDDVRQKTAQQMLDDGWTAMVMKFSVDPNERAEFDPRYFEWAARVGKMASEDAVAPFCFTRHDGTVCHGVAVWRPAQEQDSASDERMVE